jgi:hypothetical protein
MPKLGSRLSSKERRKPEPEPVLVKEPVTSARRERKVQFEIRVKNVFPEQHVLNKLRLILI